MRYTIYKTINTLNGKFYIGKHQTSDPNDRYLGSGKALRLAIKKYGKKNFIKEILFVFDTEEEMNEKEKELVTQELITSTQCYNCGIGGEGGPQFRGRKHSEETRQKLRNIALERKYTQETRLKISQNNWSRKDPVSQRMHAKTAGARATRNPEKISASLKEYYAKHSSKGRKFMVVRCPVCNKEGGINAMTRWHFDNCKAKVLHEQISSNS